MGKLITRIPIISEEKQEKYSVIPANEIRLPTDNLSTILFGLTDKQFTQLLSEERPSKKVKESEKQKVDNKYKEIEATTRFWLNVVEGCDGQIAKLSHADQRVLAACMAEQQKGNPVTTTSIIFRDLGGVGLPKPGVVEEYIQSITKMMSLIITIDATETVKKLYQIHDDTFLKVIDGKSILPASWRYIKLNGQSCAAIKFNDVSPVFQYALAKGQITTIPSKILNVPATKNTQDFLELKTYIYTRIQQAKKGRIKPIMRIETLYKNCGFEVKVNDRFFRKRLRENIVNFMEWLVINDEIINFKCVDDNNQEYHNLKDCTKITFTYKKSNKQT